MDSTADTKCPDVSQKPRHRLIASEENFDQDDRKVTSGLMGILHCHSPFTL